MAVVAVVGMHRHRLTCMADRNTSLAARWLTNGIAIAIGTTTGLTDAGVVAVGLARCGWCVVANCIPFVFLFVHYVILCIFVCC